MKLVGVALAVVVLVAVGAAVYSSIASVPRGSTPEHSARYYPDDVMAYAWFTRDPSM